MKALVTGSSGLIGSHLCEALLTAGWTVHGIDVAPSPAKLTKWEHFHGWQSSLADVEIECTHKGEHYCATVDICRGLDVIFHLAARVGVDDVLANPLAVLTEHADDIHKVCRLALREKAVLVAASSSEVYGSSGVPLREDDWPTVAPTHLTRGCYAVSKLYVEQVAMAYARQHGLRVVLPRFFNIAGPGQRESFVLAKWIKAALTGQPLRVHEGSHERCFMHVVDCVTALIRLGETARALGYCEVVNVGSRHVARMREVAIGIRGLATVRYELDTVSEIELVPSDKLDVNGAYGEMRQRIPDTSRLWRLTGFKCEDRLAEIITDMADYTAAELGIRRRDGGAETGTVDVAAVPTPATGARDD